MNESSHPAVRGRERHVSVSRASRCPGPRACGARRRRPRRLCGCAPDASFERVVARDDLERREEVAALPRDETRRSGRTRSSVGGERRVVHAPGDVGREAHRGAAERDRARRHGAEGHLRARGKPAPRRRRPRARRAVPEPWEEVVRAPSSSCRVYVRGRVDRKKHGCYVPASFFREAHGRSRNKHTCFKCGTKFYDLKKNARPVSEVRHGSEGRASAADVARRPARGAAREARRVRGSGRFRP